MTSGYGGLKADEADVGKRTKASVDYRKAEGAHRCHNCRSMLDSGRCRKVKGIVAPDHVCDLWTAEAK
jgi:hypothetical protein